MDDSLSAASSAGHTPARSAASRRSYSRRSSRSGDSILSGASEPADLVAETRRITANGFCRALYYKPGDSTQYICGGKATCRKSGHRLARSTPDQVGLPGIYDVRLSNRGRVVGIIAATRQNAADYAARQTEQRTQNRLLTETITQLNQPELAVLTQPTVPAPAPAPASPATLAPPVPPAPVPAPLVAHPPAVVVHVPVPAAPVVAPVLVPPVLPTPAPPVPVAPAALPVPIPPVPPVPANVPIPVPVPTPGPAASADTKEMLARLMEAVTNLSADVQATRKEQELLKQQATTGVTQAPPAVSTLPQPGILRTGGVAARMQAPVPPGLQPMETTDQLLLQQLASQPPAAPTVVPPPALRQARRVALGKDASIGDKSSAYGCKVSNGLKLARTLAPEGLSQEGAARFCEGLSDVVAYPKGEGTSDSHEGNVLFQVMSSLVDNRNQGSGGQVDASFKNANRNVLGKVNSMEKLRNLVETFTDEGEDLVAAMAGRWCNTLTSLLHVEDQEAEEIVQLCPLFRVGTRTVELYLLLLNHLLSLCYQEGSVSSFEHCKPSLQYHAGKLGKVRDTYNIRIQVLVGIYVYLRDALSSNFRPPKLLAREVDTLRRRLDSSSASSGGTASTTTGLCRHCSTTLHGTATCPWRGVSSAKAKKEAAKALVAMSSGANVTAGAPATGSPQE